MIDLADPNNDQLLRQVAGQVTTITTQLEGISKDVGVLKTDVGTLKMDVHDLKTDVHTLKLVQGQQGITLRSMQIDINSLKSSYQSQATEVRRIGVLFEDLEHRFEAGTELG